VFFYLGKFFAPLNIVTLYPKWNIDPGNPLWWTPLIVLLCLISAGLAARKSLDNRFWWGIVNFIAPLAPVVGIVPFGWFQASYVGLHLMYLSMIGLSCCVGMFFTTVWGRTTGVLKKVTVALGCLWLLILPALGFYHAQIWSDQLSLWEVNKKVYPKNPVVLNMLGLAEMAAGKYRAAEENFHQAITHDPKHWRAHLNLGLSQLNQDMLEDAEQSLRRAIELNPKSYGAYIGLAQTHKKRGNFEKTRQSLQKAIELGAKEPKTYNDLGNLMLGAGRIDQALRLFKEAIDLNPLAAQPYNNLGAAFMSKNLPSQALEAFEKAISLKPGYAMAHANAGFACLSLKRPNCAVTHLKMALELDPTLERAKHHLRRITKTKGRP
jgi:tetratricopeptide (TPR) repeat protein